MAHSSAYRMEHTHVSCPRCSHPVLLVDPGYTLPLVAAMIPCSLRALRAHLSRVSYPRRYRRDGAGHRRQRVLYASEVARIRERMLVGDV